MKTVQDLRFVSSRDYGKTQCGNSWSWMKSKFEDFDIWYVLAGEGEIRINGEPFGVRQGACCVLRPGDSVEASQHPDRRISLIYFHFRIFNAETGAVVTEDSSLPPRYNLMEDYWLEQHLHALLEFAAREGAYSGDLVHITLKLILTQLMYWREEAEQRTSFRHRHLMQKIVDHIRWNIHRPIRHEELAQLVSLSSRYVSRLFKEFTGCSLKEYMKRERLERARTLLTITDNNVSRVAEQLGYSDIYLFSNQFKQHYGMSPSTYQRNLRKSKLVALPVKR